jgi:hypothetical protein
MTPVRRILVVGLLLSAAAPATAGAACQRRAGGERYTVRVVEWAAQHTRTRTKVVSCDRHTGRTRTLAHAVYRHREGDTPFERRPVGGRLLADADAAGRWGVWIAAETGGRRMRATLTLADLRRGRVVSRRLADRAARFEPELLEVVVTSRRETAWVVPSDRTRNGTRIDLHRPGRRVRTVVDEAPSDLAVEDDRTLRWLDGKFRVGYADLPRRRSGGCPRRSRFRRHPLSTAEILLTAATYRAGRDFDGSDGEEDAYVVRACWRPTGRDRVLDQAIGDGQTAENLVVVGAQGEWVALTSYLSARDSCGGRTLETISVRDGRLGRRATGRDCASPPGAPDVTEIPGAAVITSRGVPAWVDRRDDGDHVTVGGASGRPEDLDAAPRGAIGGLRADGDRLHWTNAGQPRSATP